MSTQTLTHTVTTDTAEPVTGPVLPADDRAGDGYDWMDTLDGTAWSVLPNWGSEGWDAGSWPHIIFAVARTRDRNGELFGSGTYVEGDTTTHWYRSQDACFEAITAEVFFHWTSGQSDGPDNLPTAPPNCPLRTGNPSANGRPGVTFIAAKTPPFIAAIHSVSGWQVPRKPGSCLVPTTCLTPLVSETSETDL